MRAVDTNVLVRLVTRDHRRQVAAAELFVSKGAWVSTLVLTEATWVLTAVYELTHGEIATAIDMLLHHRDLTIQESDSVAAALEQYRNRPALGFSDCLILETARKAGHLPLGTFDRNLSKLDGAEGLWLPRLGAEESRGLFPLNSPQGGVQGRGRSPGGRSGSPL